MSTYKEVLLSKFPSMHRMVDLTSLKIPKITPIETHEDSEAMYWFNYRLPKVIPKKKSGYTGMYCIKGNSALLIGWANHIEQGWPCMRVTKIRGTKVIKSDTEYACYACYLLSKMKNTR